jgi:hypothetical protein
VLSRAIAECQCPLHAAEDVRRFCLHRHQAGDGLAAFGDDHFETLLLDLVHQVQAFRLEFTGWNRLRDHGHLVMTMMSPDG